MPRFISVAAGATVMTLALTPGAAVAVGGRSQAARPPTSRATEHHRAQARGAARRRQRRNAVVAGRHHAVADLRPGGGHQQAAGSGRVRALQRQLAVLGFSPGPVDGLYGPLTRAAVARFQATAGLTVDGVAGPDTLSAVRATVGAALAPGAGDRRRGGSERVPALQRALAALRLAPGPADGRYGPLTAYAVKRFQRDHDLAATDVVEIGMMGAIETAVRQGPRPTPTSTRRWGR